MIFLSIVLLICVIIYAWCLFLDIIFLNDILKAKKRMEQQRKEDEEFARFVKQARAISNCLIGPIASETIIIKK